MSFQDLLLTYGYPILFLGVLLEGEVFIILCVYLASKGYFSLPGIIIVAALSSFLSTQLYFYLGRHYGQAFLAKRPRWQSRLSRVQTLLHRYGVGLVLGYRALYGVRVVIPPALGLFGYSFLRFGLLDGLGALVWAAVVALAGHQLALLAETLLNDIHHYERLLFGLVGIGTLGGLYRLYRRLNLPRSTGSALDA